MTSQTPDHTEPVPAQVDEWHRHSPEEGLPQAEHAPHANITTLLIVFVVITVATVAFSVIVAVYAIGEMDKLQGVQEQAGLRAVAPQAAAYKRAALDAQSEYGWTPEGNVRIPLEQAMQIIVQEHQIAGGAAARPVAPAATSAEIPQQ